MNTATNTAVSPRESILVFGATGKQGSAVVDALLADRKRTKSDFELRAFVRDRSSPGASKLLHAGVALYEGSYESPSSISAAISGVDRVFLNTTYDKSRNETWVTERDRGYAVVEELAKSPALKQIVFSTLPLLEGYDEGAGKAAIEARIREESLPLTTVVPPFYLENFLDVWPIMRNHLGLGARLSWGWLPTSQRLTMPHGSVLDFGKAVAVILRLSANKYLGRHAAIVVDDLSLPEILQEISLGISEKITWAPIPKKVFRKLPLSDETKKGLLFYADALKDRETVECNFLQSQSSSAATLRAAQKETLELVPDASTTRQWAALHRSELVEINRKRVLGAMTISWSMISAKLTRKLA